MPPDFFSVSFLPSSSSARVLFLAGFATPPWCEQAPLPSFAVVPSSHVTSAFAEDFAAAGTASAAAARSEIPMFRMVPPVIKLASDPPEVARPAGALLVEEREEIRLLVRPGFRWPGDCNTGNSPAPLQKLKNGKP